MPQKSRLEQLKLFLHQNPEDPFLHFALGMEYLKCGDQQKALQCLEHLAETNPGYVGTYYHLGRLYVLYNQIEKAKEVYKKGIEIAIAQRDRNSERELREALMEIEFEADE